MTQFKIVNRIGGTDLGTYEADTKEEALDAMARDAGYADYSAIPVEAHSGGVEVIEL
jgi:hypothetical protein